MIDVWENEGGTAVFEKKCRVCETELISDEPIWWACHLECAIRAAFWKFWKVWDVLDDPFKDGVTKWEGWLDNGQTA